VLFLTDIEKGWIFLANWHHKSPVKFLEAYAAERAGLQARLTLRKGNAPLSEDAAKKFQTLKSFDEIF
jgi:methionine salvage enolase-phosphatase E1